MQALVLNMDRMAELSKEIRGAVISLYKLCAEKRRSQTAEDAAWVQKEKAALYDAVMTIHNAKAWLSLDPTDIWVAQELARDYRMNVKYKKPCSKWENAVGMLNLQRGEAPKPEVAEGKTAFLVYYGYSNMPVPGFTPSTPLAFYKSEAKTAIAARMEVAQLIPRNMCVLKITTITETNV